MATKEPVFFGDFMEEVYGFAQAVKTGNTIYVAGQTAFTETGEIDAPGDMAAQMRRAYANIARVLEKAGATVDDIVDETLYVTDIMAAATVALEVRKEVYGGRFEVASSLVQVAQLGLPDLMIEIKCTAHV
jgi:enamine deaminase RidA (YjgF/YER057c/UK114 family)